MVSRSTENIHINVTADSQSAQRNLKRTDDALGSIGKSIKGMLLPLASAYLGFQALTSTIVRNAVNVAFAREEFFALEVAAQRTAIQLADMVAVQAAPYVEDLAEALTLLNKAWGEGPDEGNPLLKFLADRTIGTVIGGLAGFVRTLAGDISGLQTLLKFNPITAPWWWGFNGIKGILDKTSEAIADFLIEQKGTGNILDFPNWGKAIEGWNRPGGWIFNIRLEFEILKSRFRNTLAFFKEFRFEVPNLGEAVKGWNSPGGWIWNIRLEFEILKSQFRNLISFITELKFVAPVLNWLTEWKDKILNTFKDLIAQAKKTARDIANALNPFHKEYDPIPEGANHSHAYAYSCP